MQLILLVLFYYYCNVLKTILANLLSEIVMGYDTPLSEKEPPLIPSA